METERVNELASPQWLYMLNSPRPGQTAERPTLAALVAAGGTPKEIAERLYLTILSRLPMDADVQLAENMPRPPCRKGATCGSIWPGVDQ